MRRVVIAYETPEALKEALALATEAVAAGHDLSAVGSGFNQHGVGYAIAVHRKACPMCSAEGLAGFAWESPA